MADHARTGGRRPFVITDGAQLEALYVEQRLPVASIAVRFGCSVNTVYAALKRFGIRRPAIVPEEVSAEIQRRYRAGRSVAGVAADLRISYYRAYQEICRARIARQPRQASVSQASPDELRRIYVQQRQSMLDVAQHYGSSVSTVRQALQQHEIPSHERGRNLRPRSSTAIPSAQGADLNLTALIVHRRRNGERVAAIAEALGISMRRVLTVIAQHDCAPITGADTDEQLGSAYDNGVSVNQLAHRHNRSPDFVRAAIARYLSRSSM